MTRAPDRIHVMPTLTQRPAFPCGAVCVLPGGDQPRAGRVATSAMNLGPWSFTEQGPPGHLRSPSKGFCGRVPPGTHLLYSHDLRGGHHCQTGNLRLRGSSTKVPQSRER